MEAAELRTAVYRHWISLSALAVGCCPLILASLKRNSARLPFLLGLGLFVVGICALLDVTYPDIVPSRLSIWEASSSRLSQAFLLAGAAIVTPVVIAYSLFAYWVFRGKTPAQGWDS
jgi:cytochrome bd ubiquinol oxidase subunit II